MNQLISGQYSSIDQIRGQIFPANPVKETQATSDISFEDVLKGKQNEQVMESSSLKFSKHASMRLSDRNIDLTEDVNRRLENGVEQASRKGVQESLVLVDSLAFIVNVPNRTVVTAMDQTETNSNVFTNIDGAVIM
jgi:flagellar operon protein